MNFHAPRGARPAQKLAPANIAAEKALLGAILVDNRVIERVGEIIAEEHFFDPLHAHIFKTIIGLAGKGKVITPTVLLPFYEDAEPIDHLTTVPQYLGSLLANATTTINAASYAREIVEMARRRSLIVIGEDMTAAAYDLHGEADVSGQIEVVEKQLLKVADNALVSNAERYGDIMKGVVADALKAKKMGGRPLGLSTGFPDLDKRLGGLEPGHLIVIGGRPSMGKTAMAVNIASHIARSAEKITGDGEIVADAIVMMFSQEMSKAEVGLRVLASDTGIPANLIKTGNFDDVEAERLRSAIRAHSDDRLIIDDASGLTLQKIAARARRQKRQGGLDALVIDYLQIMQLGKAENRNLAIGEVTAGLKQLAKELGIPIILLSQLSRDNEKRSDKRPQLSDLRESGNIEQDADVVIFVHREEYYIEREKPPEHDAVKTAEWEAKIGQVRGKAEAILAKVRNGEVGVVGLAWEGAMSRFNNLAREAPR
ncbi:MAG: replicative DNA helicase [Proteobacteria bacterium]|nr:replicative DNA helicase [Pseudomonadota bacterium]